MHLLKQPILPIDPPSVSGEAEEARNNLALAAAAITSITTPEANDAARVWAVEIRNYLKRVEAMRVELTQPLLHTQRLLKALSDDHIAPLKAELDRLERLATRFMEAEQVRVAAELKARLQLAAEAKTDEDFNTISNEAMPVVEKARGQTMKQVMRWEVTDIRALYAARPELCRIEPSAAAINACCTPNMPNLPPGIKLWWENVSSYTTR